MAFRTVFDVSRVFDFVSERMPMCKVQGMTGIGLERDGELVAGVLYEAFNGYNVWMHVAAVPGGRWMTREYLRTCFAYPFIILGAQRVSAQVDASNAAAHKLDAHIGFKPEAKLTGAAQDGGDVILYVMWKKECRYVDPQ
jgi:RimJ/RimL family protein N-acetyltransferase